MELSAFRREGSNKHIKDCECASQQLKFKIRALNNKERERAAELASLHDMESTSRALDKKEQEIESAFLGNIRDEPSSSYAGGPQGSDARPHNSNFSNPSSVANADNAASNILAGKLVREKYPYIIFGGCVAHGLDLLMEDIGKLPWVSGVVDDCRSFI
ncbi:hypothetical protein R1flu_000245 [Riccia fluitans]|uniref:DUF659 domain-containing protein n=1 Tax=Riccia fluitans TaxID=41844 RepID=A0ABD1XZW5_9MARC